MVSAEEAARFRKEFGPVPTWTVDNTRYTIIQRASTPCVNPESRQKLRTWVIWHDVAERYGFWRSLPRTLPTPVSGRRVRALVSPRLTAEG